MGKLFSFRYALLLSILLFSIGSYSLVKKYIYTNKEEDISFLQQDHSAATMDLDTVNPEFDMLGAAIDSLKDSSLVKNPFLIQNDKALNVSGTWITLGESADSLQDKLGSPSRIAKTEMDYEYYVYNNNYKKLLFVAIKDNEVAGYYTDSLDFNYLGISSGSSLERVNRSLNTDLTMNYVLIHTTEQYALHIFMDEIGGGIVTGMSLMATDVKEKDYSAEIIRDKELLIYDITNSMRKRNGLPILSWSSTAAKASAKHSIDMAENRYFDHYNLYHKDPGDRLKEEGIYYQSIGENIIAGHENAIISCHAWYNSQEHRDNILNKKYTSLGVGLTYMEDSIYKTYITQMFYR